MIARAGAPTVKSGASARILPILAAVLVLSAWAPRASAAPIEVCFSPPLPGGCDPARAIQDAIGAARQSILIQAYEITPGPPVAALIAAHRRGVNVRAIVDYRQLHDRRYHEDARAVGELAAAGIPVMVDHPPGLMHDKVMVIDAATVVTGSFNYTFSAEHRNVENLLLIHDPALAAQYTRHWQSRADVSRMLSGIGDESALFPAPAGSYASPTVAGPIVGDRRTRIYEWPGCPYYNRVSWRDRVYFASAAEAEQAGYRAARNCR